MYRKFIIKQFQSGGGNITVKNDAYGISEDSLERIKKAENPLKKDAFNNPYIDYNETPDKLRMEKTQSGKKCEIEFDEDNTQKILTMINNDITKLKEKFVIFITDIVKIYKVTMNSYLKSLKEASNTIQDVRTYTDQMSKQIYEIQVKVKELDTNYRNVIMMLSSSYNLDKNGVYPKMSSDLNLQTSIRKFLDRNQKSIFADVFKNIDIEFDKQLPQMKVGEIDITTIEMNLGKNYLKINGQEKIQFKNVCFKLTTPTDLESVEVPEREEQIVEVEKPTSEEKHKSQ